MHDENIHKDDTDLVENMHLLLVGESSHCCFKISVKPDKALSLWSAEAHHPFFFNGGNWMIINHSGGVFLSK